MGVQHSMLYGTFKKHVYATIMCTHVKFKSALKVEIYQDHYHLKFADVLTSSSPTPPHPPLSEEFVHWWG